MTRAALLLLIAAGMLAGCEAPPPAAVETRTLPEAPPPDARISLVRAFGGTWHWTLVNASNGELVDMVDIGARPDRAPRLSGDGRHAIVDVPVAPGSDRMRTFIADLEAGRVSVFDEAGGRGAFDGDTPHYVIRTPKAPPSMLQRLRSLAVPGADPCEPPTARDFAFSDGALSLKQQKLGTCADPVPPDVELRALRATALAAISAYPTFRPEKLEAELRKMRNGRWAFDLSDDGGGVAVVSGDGIPSGETHFVPIAKGRKVPEGASIVVERGTLGHNRQHGRWLAVAVNRGLGDVVVIVFDLETGRETVRIENPKDLELWIAPP